MLPTKGYFQDIECPYYNNTCSRPYCHFRHRKKGPEPVEDIAPEPAPEPEVPTYKPTPKSELANIKTSHIPISYVPDLAFRPTERAPRPAPKITYKPTPLSILSSANKSGNSTPDYGDEEHANRDENREAIREIKLNIASVEYNPEVSLQDEINFEDLSAEFDLISDIIDFPSPDVGECIDKKNEKEKHDEPIEKPTISSHEPSKKMDKEKDSGSKSRDSKSRSKSKHHHHEAKDSKEKSKHADKDSKHKSSSSSSKTKEVKEKESSREKQSKSSHHKSRHKSSSRNKDREHSKDKDKNRKSTSSGSRSKDKHKDKVKKAKEKSSDSDNDNGEIPQEDFRYSDIDFDEAEDEDTLMECYKIFNEYKPEPVKLPENDQTQHETDTPIVEPPSKKRISHVSNTTSSLSTINQEVPKVKVQPSAGQIMMNRYKLAKLAQAENEQNNLMAAIKQQQQQQPSLKRPATTLLQAARNHKLKKIADAATAPKIATTTTNVVDSILNGAKKPAPKRIAPVQNVQSIQRAKARIDEMARQKAADSVAKTVAQTARGPKRVAHVPEYSLSDIPDVLNADKSKLPVNVRSRFLTMIADETVKLYEAKEEAYNRALQEEFACYEKCKVIVTYRNSAMLAVNRIRKEVQEREKLGKGPMGSGEAAGRGKSSDGKKFYDNVKKYVMSDEELDIHGYPRESPIPGKAVIKNPYRKRANPVKLPDDQRQCSRCKKIYIVDRKCFPLYAEECVYHPLKKRTLRGEQTYLCCKSNDDTGCATSNTHVCEMAEDAELEGYQVTMEPERLDDPRSTAVYALDCEMCYTVKGLELTRVTIVDADCKTVYESLVKPLNPIIDYNTNFSGITKEQMDRTSTGILQVQANILHLCNSRTILIGHSLESDMKALKIIHGTVIDTSVMFPHKMGLPHKRALRVLASDFLKKIIQNNVSGHDSAEDAIACMELVKWKLKEELKVRGVK